MSCTPREGESESRFNFSHLKVSVVSLRWQRTTQLPWKWLSPCVLFVARMNIFCGFASEVRERLSVPFLRVAHGVLHVRLIDPPS